MKLETRQFGTLDVPEDGILTFPAGLPGFEDSRRYVVIEDGLITPFRWLQSLDDAELAFLTIPPEFVKPGYLVDISAEARAALGLVDGATPETLLVVTVPENPQSMTANLRAPLLINRAAHLGRQEISASDRYPLRYRILAEASAQQSAAGIK